MINIHPLAELFPKMEGAELDALVDDIRKNGLREPVTELDGMIIDGRNRQLACDLAGVPLRTRPFPGGDPLTFVISANLTRRHLDESQRGMIAAKIENLKWGGARRGAAPAAERGGVQDLNLDLVKSPLEQAKGQPHHLPSVKREAAAGMMNVSRPTVANAASVLKHGTPELIQRVERGGVAVSLAAKVAKLPKPTQRKIAGLPDREVKTALKKLVRTEREEKLAEKQTAMPNLKFGVIVEDFEWDFEVRSRETGMDRHAANHYLVSESAHTSDEIIKRTEDRFGCAADDCVLFMWTTAPYLAVAIDVLRQRGFRYTSHYIWGKDKIATGYWNRNRHEILLIGVQGNIPAPAPGTQWDSLIMAPVGIHSAKPECFLEMIEEYFPNLPKIELNRRGAPRRGWHAWGNEAEAAE